MKQKTKMNNKSLFKGKKGDIPITILTLGVLILCILALLSFIYSLFQFKKSFEGVGSIDEISSKIEGYDFYKEDIGTSKEELGNMFDLKTESDGRKYFYVEKKGRTFDSLDGWINEKVLISIKYPVD